MLGERLRELRKKKGLSQKELAEALGLSQGYISDVEKGTKKPGSDNLLSLKNFFDVDLNWLLTGEGVPSRDATARDDSARQEVAKRGGRASGRSATGDSFFSHDQHATYEKAVANRPSYQIPQRHDPPTLDQLMKLLRMVIKTYDQIFPESVNRSRDVPVIFRHFIDNYDPDDDESDIWDYIDEWI